MFLSIPTTICFSSFFSLLIVVRMLVESIRTRVNENFFGQLKDRIRTWVVILLLLFFATLFGKNGLISFFAAVSFLAFKELISIAPTRIEDRRAIFWAYIAIPGQYLLIGAGFYVFSLIFIPVYLSILLPIRLTLTGKTKDFLKSTSFLQWAVMMMIYCIAHSTMFFIPLTRPFPMGLRITTVLYLIMLTQLNDIFQFVYGKFLGKHKIAPKVSPNKTWEGFLGGVITTTLLASFVGPMMTPLNASMSLVSGLIISIAGFLGDITMSSLKRDLGIKDTSMMLPGHGGIIDRIDSLVFTAPLFFHFFNCFWMKL